MKYNLSMRFGAFLIFTGGALAGGVGGSMLGSEIRRSITPECVCAQARSEEDISDGGNSAVNSYLEKTINLLSLESGLEPGLGTGLESERSLSSFSLEAYEKDGIFRYRSANVEGAKDRVEAMQKAHFPLPSPDAEKARRGAVGRRAVDDGMKFEGNRLHELMTKTAYRCWDDAYVIAATRDDLDVDPLEYCRFVETAMWMLEQDYEDQWWSRSGFEKTEEGTTYDACFEEGRAIAQRIVFQYFRAANAAYVRKIAGESGDVRSMVAKEYMELVFGKRPIAIQQRED